MGFNRRKMEDQRREAAEKEGRPVARPMLKCSRMPSAWIGAWNERRAISAPMVFSPTIGTAIKARYWFLWVRCPACRTINAISRTSIADEMRHIVGECLANDRPGRREAALALPRFSALSGLTLSEKGFCHQRREMWRFDSASLYKQRQMFV